MAIVASNDGTKIYEDTDPAAALASVIGGLAACPVIGVPTSVGYGSAHGGETALNAMLCSCADGLAVVGIDDGVGAGSVAARIARGAAGR